MNLLYFITEACLSCLGLLLFSIPWNRWEKQKLMWPAHTWMSWRHCSIWLTATSLMESQDRQNAVRDVRNVIEVSRRQSGGPRNKWLSQPRGIMFWGKGLLTWLLWDELGADQMDRMAEPKHTKESRADHGEEGSMGACFRMWWVLEREDEHCRRVVGARPRECYRRWWVLERGWGRDKSMGHWGL